MMMRTLMVVALAALTIMVVAQEEARGTKRYEMAVDAQQLVEGVEGLAGVLEKKLGGPASDYYDVLVAKNKLYGRVGMSCGVLLVLLAIFFFKGAGDLLAKDDENGDGFITALAVLGVICAIAALILVGNYFGLLLAPEYHAMQEFLETASQFMP